jgi:hypothetical protein
MLAAKQGRESRVALQSYDCGNKGPILVGQIVKNISYSFP